MMKVQYGYFQMLQVKLILLTNWNSGHGEAKNSFETTKHSPVPLGLDLEHPSQRKDLRVLDELTSL
jgi:hypothetical protein